MKVAVTSASGQLGGATVKALIKEIGKENVIAIARTPEKAEYLGVEVRKGDYNQIQDFEKAFHDIDAVLLVSGMDEPHKRIQQHRNVITAAKNSGVKKIVYTSIIGDEDNNAFSPIVQSNRQTEIDVQSSEVNWVIGRNGIYIEPDLEYIAHYVKDGEIRNCAGDGKCTYTSREELGYAYAKMLVEDKHNGQVYNLVGEGITQAQLADYINQVYQTKLVYHPVSAEDYATERKKELGDFLGTVISGIYEGINSGANDVPSDYEKASGRKHPTPLSMIESYRQNHS